MQFCISPNLILITQSTILANKEFYKFHPYVQFISENNKNFEGFIVSVDSSVIIQKISYKQKYSDIYEDWSEISPNESVWVSCVQVYFEDQKQVYGTKLM